MSHELVQSREDAFKYIASASLYGNLGFFIGAGLPMAVLNSTKDIALSWGKLIVKAAKEHKIDGNLIPKEGNSFPAIASMICKNIADEKGLTYEEAVIQFKKTIAKLTSWYPESDSRIEFSEYFENISPSWIITTNYDNIIECILPGKAYSLSSDDALVAPKDLIPVYHLHGIRSNPDSIVITQEDYIKLFRPNQYRQQKLPLLLKEAVTLFIGYGLGDFNVLTAVDWARHVYSEQKNSYPQELIQIIYTEKPKRNPYRDKNNIVIIECDNLATLLRELSNFIYNFKRQEEIDLREVNKIKKQLEPATPRKAEKFIDDEKFRRDILQMLKQHPIQLISSFIGLFQKSIDITWARAAPWNSFWAYDQQLNMLLDITEY